jgi:hypothetical protein
VSAMVRNRDPIAEGTEAADAAKTPSRPRSLTSFWPKISRPLQRDPEHRQRDNEPAGGDSGCRTSAPFRRSKVWDLFSVSGKQSRLALSDEFRTHVALHHPQRGQREILVDMSDGIAGDNDLEVTDVGIKR